MGHTFAVFFSNTKESKTITQPAIVFLLAVCRQTWDASWCKKTVSWGSVRDKRRHNTLCGRTSNVLFGSARKEIFSVSFRAVLAVSLCKCCFTPIRCLCSWIYPFHRLCWRSGWVTSRHDTHTFSATWHLLNLLLYTLYCLANFMLHVLTADLLFDRLCSVSAPVASVQYILTADRITMRGNSMRNLQQRLQSFLTQGRNLCLFYYYVTVPPGNSNMTFRPLK